MKGMFSTYTLSTVWQYALMIIYNTNGKKKKSKIDPFMPFVCQGWNTRVLLTVELYIIDWLHHEKNVFYSLWIIHNEGVYMYMYFRSVYFRKFYFLL